LKIDPTVIVCC